MVRAAGRESTDVLGGLSERWENLTNIRDQVATHRAELFLAHAKDLVDGR
ncbi:hypothetical protein [Actinosynnema sp. NPDC023587]